MKKHIDQWFSKHEPDPELVKNATLGLHLRPTESEMLCIEFSNRVVTSPPGHMDALLNLRATDLDKFGPRPTVSPPWTSNGLGIYH